MLSPLLFISILFAIGIILQPFLISSQRLLLVLMGLMLLFSIVFFRKCRLRGSIIILSVYFIAAGIYFARLAQEEYYSNLAYRIIYVDHVIPLKEPVHAEFVLVDEPMDSDDKIYFTAKIHKLEYGGLDYVVNSKARISVSKGEDTRWKNWHYGDVLQSYLIFTTPVEYENEGAFDYNRYLYVQNIHLIAHAKSSYLINGNGGIKANRVIRKIYMLKSYLLVIADKYFCNDGKVTQEAAFVEAMLTGKRENLSDETNDLMQKAGLYHLIAISGFNISIIFIFIYFVLFRIFGFSRKISQVCLLLGVPVFVIISSASASVERAAIMSSFLIAGLLLYQPAGLLNGIGLSALIILVMNPASIFDVGFQLTYLVTISIVTVGAKIRGYFPQWGDFFWINISCSLASQLSTVFHSVILYHRLSIVSVLLNILGIPLFSLLLILGFIFVLIPVHIVRFGISAVMKILLWLFFWMTKYCCAWSWSYMLIGSPPLILVSLGMISLLGIIYIQRKAIKIFLFVLLCVILVIALFKVRSDDNFEVLMIDVGYGDSIFMRFPDGHTLLIDGGGSVFSDFDIGKNVVASTLLHHGITRIDYILLSHEHPDHIKGLTYIIREFKVKELWDSNCTYKKSICRDLLFWARIKKVKIRKLNSGDSISMGSAQIQVLYSPMGKPFAKINNNSVVIRISVYGRTLLFTGDIEKEVEEILEHQNGLPLKAHIIKVPHHGSRTSSTSNFLNAVGSKIALLSVGKNNFYGLPNEEIIGSYLARGIEIYRTDLDGQIQLCITPDGGISAVQYNWWQSSIF